jgi:hypothetical protein
MKNIVEIEIEQPETGRLMHMLFDIENVILYQEVNCLPESIILCAMFDNEIMMEGLVGKKDQQVKKQFLKVDWLLEQLDPELREALQTRKDYEISQLEYYREKYREQENE